MNVMPKPVDTSTRAGRVVRRSSRLCMDFWTVRRSSGYRLLYCCLAVWMAFVESTVAAEVPPGDANAAVLHLSNGDFLNGRLVDSSGEHLAWQSPAFLSAFEFAVPSINSIQFPLPEKLTQPAGDYCFELAGGDVLFGSLVSMDAGSAILDVAGIGRMQVDRSILRRMYRWKGGDELLYFGPSGLAGWQTAEVPNGWTEEAGQLISNKNGAVLRRDFGLPPMARFEFELSWKEKADFDFALGVGNIKSAQRAFRFEVWDNELIVQRETENEWDAASLQSIKPASAGRLHLLVFLDQEKGRLLVFTSGGQPLADLTVPLTRHQTFGGVQLTNKSGDVRLERLSIGRWNGETPRAVESDKSRVHSSDGGITYGQLMSYDPAERQFVLDSAGTEQNISQERVQDVYFSQETTVAPRALRAMYRNGQRISGDLIKIENDAVWLRCPGIKDAVVVPIESLQSLVRLTTAGEQPPASTEAATSREGRLELLETSLRGHLVGTAESQPGELIWQPNYSKRPSPLKTGTSARVVYREPVQKLKPQSTNTVTRARAFPVGGVAFVTNSATSSATPVRSIGSRKPLLHLRSGDTIPCDTVAIDEDGVRFGSPITDATFIRHDQLKVLELIPDATPVEIARQKKERLLVLPRMQRDNPPTQLIRSVDGDYLRGRLVAMDGEQIQLEIRLDVKTLHRDRVARIIWLHSDEMETAAKPAILDTVSTGHRVQAFAEGSDQIALATQAVAGRRGQIALATQAINEQRLEKALSVTMTVEFAQTPLSEALELLKKERQIDFKVDQEALREAGIGVNPTVTARAKGTSVRNVLRLMLDPLRLTWFIKDDVVVITLRSRAPKPTLGNNRLTFVAEQINESILSGRSDLLGACHVDLWQIDSLLIGPAIEQNAAKLVFHQWRLTSAADPLASNDDGDGSGSATEGMESALVGKPAPEIDLDLLDGTKFVLSGQRGKIIVLDFWASWCGPCLQVMPQVDAVAHEFADQGVKLVAINLEEQEDRIKAALDRLKLKTQVALDRDGRTAERYGATSIPQTVIIDREGNVVRLFVGGGARFGDQLRTALQEVLSEKLESTMED
jgi:thiol-disulfide isomerase/thioredoxin